MIRFRSLSTAALGIGEADKSERVYGWRGALKIVSESPASTVLPKYMTTTRSAIDRTTAKSCVMNRYAIPTSSCRLESKSVICAWTLTSSALTGSSAHDEIWLNRERTRNRHALLLTSTQLVWIT